MLAVYRAVVAIPTPGIDARRSRAFFEQMRRFGARPGQPVLGGALEQFSIVALGIMPYIRPSIILQLMTVVIPHLERLSKEGEVGRRKITQYTPLRHRGPRHRPGPLHQHGPGEAAGAGRRRRRLRAGLELPGDDVITLASGTAFLMWLGEQISERGIGNGISMIIFAGIVANFRPPRSPPPSSCAKGRWGS
jgi:preprotein translocase subunit SecY